MTELLPPNATTLERALSAATARIGNVALPLAELWDPKTCPADLLPWLAWSLSVDRWDADWPIARKRRAVATSIADHRLKGTRASVEAVLASFDDLLRVAEWWERGLDPHRFDIVLPLSGPGIGPGGYRATAAFAAAVVREVTRVKPLREHFRFVQEHLAAAAEGLVPVARFGVFLRDDRRLVIDESLPWADFIQTEDGSPLRDNRGGFIDGSA